MKLAKFLRINIGVIIWCVRIVVYLLAFSDAHVIATSLSGALNEQQAFESAGATGGGDSIEVMQMALAIQKLGGILELILIMVVIEFAYHLYKKRSRKFTVSQNSSPDTKASFE